MIWGLKCLRQDDPPVYPQPRGVRNQNMGLLGLYTLFFFGIAGLTLYSINSKDSFFKAQNDRYGSDGV